jgi:hypothetical protein
MVVRDFGSDKTWRRGLKAAGTKGLDGGKGGGMNRSKIQNVQH